MITWHFHTYDDPHPAAPADRWVGEYWPDEDDTGAPWGVCWVAEYPAPIHATLWYVLVADPYRRQKIATELVAAARARWPGIFVTEGVTPAGEALFASLPDDPAFEAKLRAAP
jgi:GNAT superfamily N-acetyltransferase